MFSVTFLLILIFETLLYGSYAITITNWLGNRILENVRQENNLGLLTTPSAIACAVECANVLPCMSYSYHAGNNTCLLYSIPFTSETEGIVNEDGWTSYNSMCGSGSADLDYFYKQSLNMCYQLESDDFKNTTEAMAICSIRGRMIRIDTSEKQAHIVELLTSRSSKSVYIGGWSERRDDVFLYEDGTPVTSFFWKIGNPIGKYAIRMKRDGNFKWGNNFGSSLKPFLCEIVL